MIRVSVVCKILPNKGTGARVGKGGMDPQLGPVTCKMRNFGVSRQPPIAVVSAGVVVKKHVLCSKTVNKNSLL